MGQLTNYAQRKYKESKTEASNAQATLEKEITTLRDTGRNLSLKLRDSEVANDDFERQARNTTSSLEDMEAKYNQTLERGVMLEEEIKMGEQEREKLRIDSQRMKEELSDAKIELDLLQDKLKKQEARHLSTISTDLSALGSPTFDKHGENSPNSTASSPLVTTPPESKAADTASEISELADPPSPPMSDASSALPKNPTATAKTPASNLSSVARKSRLPSADNSTTPKPRGLPQPGTVSRVPRTSIGGGVPLRTPASRSTAGRPGAHKLPTSNSLTHIRTLTAQMQRLEARVQSARSKLPAPIHTPPRASPRSAANPNIPSTVTIRSRKRTIGSTASSSVAGDDTPTNFSASTSGKPSHVPRLSTSGVSRLSFGPLPNRGHEGDSRPSSRASMSSYARPASRTDMIPPPRPHSRTSLTGTRTPLGRPRSSMSLHSHSQSLSQRPMDLEEEDESEFRTPSRRGTYSKFDDGASGIPLPSSGIPVPGSIRRQSGGRRTSTGIPTGRQSASGIRRLGDLGETY